MAHLDTAVGASIMEVEGVLSPVEGEREAFEEMEAPQHSGSSYIVIDAERCKGCHLCVHACPKGIIAPASHTNQKGYILAEVIAAKAQECTGCTACALICPDAAISVYRHSRVLSPAAT